MTYFMTKLTPLFVNSALRTIARLAAGGAFPSMKEISAALNVAPSTAVRVMDILEEAGEITCGATKDGKRVERGCHLTGAYFLGNVPTKRTGTNLSLT